MSEKQYYCCASVNNGDTFRSRACCNKAKTVHQGKHYCYVHDPVKKSSREEIKQDAFDIKQAKRQLKHAIGLAKNDVVEAAKMVSQYQFGSAGKNVLLDLSLAVLKKLEEKAEPDEDR